MANQPGMTSPMAPATGYQVTAQMPSMAIGPDGKPAPGIQVTIATAKGHVASTFIPQSLYNVEYARGVLNELAAQLDAVGGLNGSN